MTLKRGSKLDLETPCYCLPMMLLASFFSTSSIVQVLTSFLTSEDLWSGSIKWSFLQFILTFAMRRKLLGNFPRSFLKRWFTSFCKLYLYVILNLCDLKGFKNNFLIKVDLEFFECFEFCLFFKCLFLPCLHSNLSVWQLLVGAWENV